MTAIRVRPERLLSLSGDLSRLSDALQELDSRLNAQIQSLSWQAAAKAAVEQLAAEGRRHNARLAGEARQLSGFLSMKAEQFLEADRQGTAGPRAVAGGAAQPAGPASPLDPAQGDIRIDSQAFLNASKPERMKMLMPAFQALDRRFGVPWQIQAAQWAIESGWGEARPKDIATGQESYNMFGMKGKGPAGTVQSPTWEHVNGRDIEVVAGFRAYHNFGESLVDHASLFKNDRYKEAMKSGEDLHRWCEMLGPRSAGYATDPAYPQKLWNFMKAEGWV